VIEPHSPLQNEEGGKWQGLQTGAQGNRQAEASSPPPPMGRSGAGVKIPPVGGCPPCANRAAKLGPLFLGDKSGYRTAKMNVNRYLTLSAITPFNQASPV